MEKAARLVRQAADRNEKYAQYTLARYYQFGKGVPESDREAVYWFRRAADNDSALAMDALAQAYRRGELGLERSPLHYDEWERRARETRERTHEVDPATWTLFDWIKYKFFD